MGWPAKKRDRLWVGPYLIQAQKIRFGPSQNGWVQVGSANFNLFAKTDGFRLGQRISAYFAMFYSKLVKNKMSPSHGPFDIHTQCLE